MNFGEIIKSLRTALKLSQQELAQQAGVSQQLIAAIESGRVTETRKLPLLAGAFGMTVDQLLNCIREPNELVKNGTVMVPVVPPAASLVHLTPDEKALLIGYRSASRAGKQAIIGAATGVLQRQTAVLAAGLSKAVDLLRTDDRRAANDAAAELRKLRDEALPGKVERFGDDELEIELLRSAGQPKTKNGKAETKAKDRGSKKSRNKG